jgi:Fe-S cluster biosynthesis and repair protein YggX
MVERNVLCSRYKKTLPGLEKAPFGGDLGRRIYENVSAQAWREWKEEMQIKVLNEYRLNMADSKDYQVMLDQMMIFLNLKQGEVVEVENAKRGGS